MAAAPAAYSSGSDCLRPGKQLRRRAMASGTELLLCRVAAAPAAYLSGSDCLLWPGKQRRRRAMASGTGCVYTGGGCATRPTTPNHRWRRAAETAGAGGLNIAETFPEVGQPAWMRAEGRVLQGRCLGPTRSLQG
ncbi:hypothetical protein J4734_11135 [Klebsiella pneumoniae]|uniref:Uncharacterized protein n=1 Tax=Klebsiella pneumoniae TaxID=573 RepID=A0A939NSB4_KLEPN|nr:hypothetical protein [Klebsiella pneumoniae]